MSTSKHRTKHKQQLLKFKTKNKQKMSEQNQQQSPQMPEVRNVPVWASNAEIVITGFEWEAIQNSLIQVQVMQQAAQAVMTRNILNGTIKMDFEKLNPKTLQYEPMSDEDKKEHKEAFAKIIDGIKAQQELQAKQANPQNDVQEANVNTEDPVANEAYSAILDETGQPVLKQEAKVIEMLPKG